MLTKTEKPLLFLTLIVLISVNVYISCKIVPTHEGFIKKVIRSVTGVITKQIPKLIVNLLIKTPIKAIPHKGLRDFFLKQVVFDKGLPRAIMSLMWAFVVAIFILLVMVPVITFMMMPFVISVMKLLMVQAVKGIARLFHVDTSAKMMNMAKQAMKSATGSPSGMDNGEAKKTLLNVKLPSFETTGENPYEKNIQKNKDVIPEHQTNPMEFYNKLKKVPTMTNSMVDAQMFNDMRKHYKQTLPKKTNMAKYSPFMQTVGTSGSKDVFKMGSSSGSIMGNVTTGLSSFAGI